MKLPVVATVAAAARRAPRAAPPDIPAGALLAAQGAEIPVWDLADLGVPPDRVRRADQTLRYDRPRPVRPRLRPIAAPDSALPAFDRILKLVQGSVQRREGRVVQKPAEEIVEEVFRTLKDEGWLDHLRSRRPTVIPLQYRLRESVRLEPATDRQAGASSASRPSAVLTVNEAAARLLKRARYGASVADLAAGFALARGARLRPLRALPQPGDPRSRPGCLSMRASPRR